jgi:hypothetical protein
MYVWQHILSSTAQNRYARSHVAAIGAIEVEVDVLLLVLLLLLLLEPECPV